MTKDNTLKKKERQTRINTKIEIKQKKKMTLDKVQIKSIYTMSWVTEKIKNPSSF